MYEAFELIVCKYHFDTWLMLHGISPILFGFPLVIFLSFFFRKILDTSNFFNATAYCHINFFCNLKKHWITALIENLNMIRIFWSSMIINLGNLVEKHYIFSEKTDILFLNQSCNCTTNSYNCISCDKCYQILGSSNLTYIVYDRINLNLEKCIIISSMSVYKPDNWIIHYAN